jgi:type III secretory pathway component EscU
MLNNREKTNGTCITTERGVRVRDMALISVISWRSVNLGDQLLQYIATYFCMYNWYSHMNYKELLSNTPCNILTICIQCHLCSCVLYNMCSALIVSWLLYNIVDYYYRRWIIAENVKPTYSFTWKWFRK